MTDFWINYIFPFLTITGILWLYFFIKSLLPSYFAEKGKNLATKEDISEVTELVESAKVVFTTETEKLKANLAFLTTVEVGLISEERNAIIDANVKYFRWLNLLVDPSLNSVNVNSNEELLKFRSLLGEYFNDFNNSQTKFNLFVQNEALVNFTYTLKIETLKRLAEHPVNCAMEMEKNNNKVFSMEKSLTHGQLPEYQELRWKQLDISKNFHKNISENYPLIVPLTVKFQDMCKKYLYELIKKDTAQIQK